MDVVRNMAIRTNSARVDSRGLLILVVIFPTSGSTNSIVLVLWSTQMRRVSSSLCRIRTTATATARVKSREAGTFWARSKGTFPTSFLDKGRLSLLPRMIAFSWTGESPTAFLLGGGILQYCIEPLIVKVPFSQSRQQSRVREPQDLLHVANSLSTSRATSAARLERWMCMATEYTSQA